MAFSDFFDVILQADTEDIIMKRSKTIAIACLVAALSLSSCVKHYQLAGIERTRVLIDSRYDKEPSEDVKQFMAQYTHTVDSLTSPLVGHLAKNMAAHRPESELSNLLADIMVWAGRDYGENPAMGVYNMGGIRASMSMGDVTFGDVLDVAPFENKICFLTLSGESLIRLFENIAAVGGEGVSKEVRLVITKDGKLKSATLNGQAIDPNASYRIATIDYLAHGNDRLEAFNEKTDFNSPQATSNDTRFIITNYFKEKMAQGVVVDANVEGRIVVSY